MKARPAEPMRQMGKHRRARKAGNALTGNDHPHPTFPDSGYLKLTTRSMTVLRVAGLVMLISAAAVAATAQSGTAPDAPQGLVVASVTHDSVTLSWSDAGDSSITGYQVLRRNRAVQAAGVFDVIDDAVAANATTYTDTTVEASTRYVYRIKARNAHGLSTRSGYVRANTPAAPEPQPQPGPVWTAVMNASVNESNEPATSGYSVWGRLGSMEPAGFEFEGSSIRVLALVKHADGLYLALSRAMPTGFTLRIGGLELASGDSFVPSMAGRGRYWWPAPGLSWSEGETAEVSMISMGIPAVPDRPPAPPGARFASFPDSHDGATPFELQLVLDEGGLPLDAATLEDAVLEVAGAAVTGIEPTSSSSARSWVITLAPAGPGAVTVVLPRTTDCAQAGAVCTADGRMLRNRVELTVPGPAGDPSLATLTLDGAQLSPAFKPDQTRYVAQADDDATETTVAFTAEDSGATVEVLAIRGDDPNLAVDSTDAGGAAGHQARLSADGDTLLLVWVTSADGLQQRLYVVVVTKPGTSQAQGSSPKRFADLKDVDGRGLARSSGVAPSLSALSLTGATLSPTFATATTGYTASATAATSQVTVAATPSSGSTMVIIPEDASSGDAGHQVALAQPLAGGAATTSPVAVIVRSADGSRLNAYTITVTRAAPTGGDATLSSLTLGDATLSPTFSATTYSYTASVPSSVTDTTLAATANDSTSTVAFSPSTDADSDTPGHQVSLSAGTNTITVTVTASDGTRRTYTVEVSRGVSNDASLSAIDVAIPDLPIQVLSPAFDPETTVYTTAVPGSYEGKILVVATPSHANATFEVDTADDYPVYHVGVGYFVELLGKTTLIAVTVIAEDRVTTRTYVFIVGQEVAAEDTARLDDLWIDGIPLAPGFTGDHFFYGALAPHDASRITLWPLPLNVQATVEVVPADADPDTPGHQLDLPAVAVGGQPIVTTVGIVVTSVDGTASQSYAIEINREVPLAPYDSPLNAHLPPGCKLIRLLTTDDGRQPHVQWKPYCRSILVYDENSSLAGMTTGYAHFYELDVQSNDDIGIRMVEYDTSHHIVLRGSDGAELQHVFYHTDHPGGAQCNGFGIACSPAPRLDATLEEGLYLVEIVQHYSTSNRQRAYNIKVDGDVALAELPTLGSITVDGAAVAGFDSERLHYRLERSAAEVTIAVAASDSTTSIIIHPADADPNTTGHQVDLGATGVTNVSVTVTDADDQLSSTYELRFFGAPPPGEPLTASFRRVPDRPSFPHRQIKFRILFSEPIHMPRSFLMDFCALYWGHGDLDPCEDGRPSGEPYFVEMRAALDVHNGSVVEVRRLNGRNDLWEITVQVHADFEPVGISLPATTSCVPEGSLCSFFGKPLSNTIRTIVLQQPLDIDLVINEVAPTGASPGWFELYNSSSSPIDLDDLKVSDGLINPSRRVPFPYDSVIRPGEYKQISLDGDGWPGFELGSSGELAIWLRGDHTLVAAVIWEEGQIPEGSSYARVPDITGAFETVAAPTPGAANSQ